ncbi:hypothetical protein BJY24_001359 [Nocardia transvalensis]|uniref:Uncharacterized protein n=1 Tax=Nocardia transvalensis TaxID=37333 RepID=A0A7W9PAK0_9NOCA|nr:hypothetical protein [Nocardia transvalensis]MBB5912492.1 hypothetical protein [Nocardia transvalensis]
MLRSQADVLHFVEEVSARYGSLDVFFARLHAGPCDTDDEPTDQLPIVTDCSAWARLTGSI